MGALLDVVKAAAGMFAVMSVWIGIQAFVRRRSRCGRDRDMLEFMLNGCGGCSNAGICTRKGKDEDRHEPL